VRKQLVQYGDLIGHHVPAVGFVQHWYWIQLLKPIVFYEQILFRKSFKNQRTSYVPPHLKSLSTRGRILTKSLVLFFKKWTILWLRHWTNEYVYKGSIKVYACVRVCVGTWCKLYLGKQMSNCCPCPLMGVVQVGLWVPTPSPWAWYSPTCGVLALHQVDFSALARSAWLVPRHPSVSLG